MSVRLNSRTLSQPPRSRPLFCMPITSRNKLFSRGNSGFALAVSGNKVLLVPEKKPEGHVCRGNCAHCRCGHKKARSESKTA